MSRLQRFTFPLKLPLAPHALFQHFANEEGALLLDSSDDSGLTSLCLRPSEIITHDIFDDLSPLRAKLNEGPKDAVKSFQGGFAGYFSYDLRCVSKIKKLADSIPLLYMGFYTDILNYDPYAKLYYLTLLRESRYAAERDYKDWVAELGAIKDTTPAPHPPVKWQPDWDKADYLSKIARVIEYIYAGDIFQACIAQRWQADLPASFAPYAYYRQLTSQSPAPYGGYLNMGGAQLLTNSPESFLSLDHTRRILTKPIKGTAPRKLDEQEDQKQAQTLLMSEKDRAENAMIVDLMRNDLSRVAERGSIAVTGFCELESYKNVHHLVSSVSAKLAEGQDIFDLLAATLPGGSISGAPKIRAMEIIEEIEATPRGPYCGALGYINTSGEAQFNILIRTMVTSE
ncbi:MAG: anthranilate synthase component I family protein, partial [Pseudobdellovibrionaceae bacterium]